MGGQLLPHMEQHHWRLRHGFGHKTRARQSRFDVSDASAREGLL